MGALVAGRLAELKEVPGEEVAALVVQGVEAAGGSKHGAALGAGAADGDGVMRDKAWASDEEVLKAVVDATKSAGGSPEDVVACVANAGAGLCAKKHGDGNGGDEKGDHLAEDVSDVVADEGGWGGVLLCDAH